MILYLRGANTCSFGSSERDDAEGVCLLLSARRKPIAARIEARWQRWRFNHLPASGRTGCKTRPQNAVCF
jgi:hypothetical protein